MIKVIATNVSCEQFSAGEQFVIVRGVALAPWCHIRIYSPEGKSDVAYNSVEQFLIEWTHIRFIEKLENKDYQSNFVGAI